MATGETNSPAVGCCPERECPHAAVQAEHLRDVRFYDGTQQAAIKRIFKSKEVSGNVAISRRRATKRRCVCHLSQRLETFA